MALSYVEVRSFSSILTSITICSFSRNLTTNIPSLEMKLLEYHEQSDLINRKTATLPKYDPRKKDLPNRSDYVGATAWLRAVQARIGDPIVYALDDALMCQNRFGGRSNEFIMWLYGSDQTTRFNGVVMLGNHISPMYVQERNPPIGR